MKTEKTSVFLRPVLTAIFTLCFAFCILSLPSAFAQTVKSAQNTDNEKEVLSRQYIELLNSVYTFVLENYVDEVDPKILYEGALKGMMDAFGDPYTVYLGSAQMRDLNDTTTGDFGGVGLSITKRHLWKLFLRLKIRRAGGRAFRQEI